MKAFIIFFIIIVAIVALALFDQFLIKGNLPASLELQENASDEEPLETNTPLTASVSQPVKQINNPILVPRGTIEETPEETSEEITGISPYYGKVRISGIQTKSSYRPSLITLSFWLRGGDAINITKWRVKAYKGEIIIPQAIEKYQNYATPTDIVIKQSGKVYLIGGPNPLGNNKNFCLNKCFGWLENYNDFYPSASAYCSKPRLEEISHLGPYCQEFILGLSRCEIPEYSDNTKIMFDMECRNYMNERFNYRSCFKDSSKDDDFLKNYWYVYKNSDIAHELHDTVYLYDQNGLLVDKRIY